MTRRWGLVLTLLALLVLAPASTASAQVPGFGDCKEAPSPEFPGDGTDAGFASTWERRTYGSSLWDQYGTAGMRLWRYDTGCTPSLEDGAQSTWNTVADFTFGLARIEVSLTDMVLRLRDSPDVLFDNVDPAVAGAADALQRAVWQPWVIVPGLLLACYVLALARKGDVPEASRATAAAILVVFVVGALGSAPVRWAQTFDGALSGSTQAFHRALNGPGDPATAASSSLHDSALYETWKASVFGSANNEAARKYALRTLQATAVTRQEAAAASTPEQRTALLEKKADDFEGLAEEVKEDYPDLYLRHFTGQDATPRVMKSALGVLVGFIGGLFLVVSTFLFLLALLICRVAIIGAPIVGLIALYRPTGHVGKLVVVGVGMAMLNAFAYAAVSALVIRLMGLVIGSPLPLAAQALLLLLIAVAGWLGARQFRSLHKRPSVQKAQDDLSKMLPSHAKEQASKALAAGAQGAVAGGAAGAAAAAVASVSEGSGDGGKGGSGSFSAAPPAAWTAPVQPTPNPAYVPPSGSPQVAPVYNVTTVGRPPEAQPERAESHGLPAGQQ